MILIRHRSATVVLRVVPADRLAGASLAHACLACADLRGADLAGADLSRADLAHADLRDARLGGADLRGALLTGALVTGATAAGARLSDGADGALLAAYHRTTYRVDAPEGSLDLRPGQSGPALDDLLERRRATTYAFITAFNPGSRPRPAADNEHDHARLVRAVRPFETLPGWGVADAGDWPPERSLLVLGIPLRAALRLGQAFGQRALVAGGRGRPADLVLCG